MGVIGDVGGPGSLIMNSGGGSHTNPPPPIGPTIPIANAAALTAALATATGGEIFSLADGTYSGVTLPGGGFHPSRTVTILGGVNAQFHTVNWSDVHNLTFQGLTLFASGSSSSGKAFAFTNFSGLAFVGVTLTSNPATPIPNTVLFGFSFTNGVGLAMSGCYFSRVRNVMTLSSVQNASIVSNIFQNWEIDGIDLFVVQNISVTNNTFLDSYPQVGDHPDCCQVFNNGASVASTNITFSNNVSRRNGGGYRQGFFCTNEKSPPLPYQNIICANNFLEGTGSNAIDIDTVNNVQITGNTIAYDPGHVAWWRLANATGTINTKTPPNVSYQN